MSTTTGKKYVPRKRQERGERRIAEIVAAAAALFAKRGFEGTSMNAIAHASGLTIGSLYQYFPNREAVIDAVAEEYLRQWRVHSDQLTASVSGLATLFEVTTNAVASLFAFHSEHAGIKAFLDADPSRAVSIQLLHQELEHGTPLLARFYPSASPADLGEVIFITGTIIRGAATTLITSACLSDRPSFVREIAVACYAYVLKRLGEPVENVGR